MKFSRSIQAVETHTMGEPTRIIIGGIPHIKGNNIAEKKQYLENNLDYLRTTIMHEPRGHNGMFGAIITGICTDKADFGIIFMDGGGYLNMCGHGSIGAATVAVETGIVPMVEPVTKVTMEAPAGIIRAKVYVKDQKVQEVAIENVPSFLYKKNQEIELPSYGKISFDISFGGSFFAIVDAKQLNLKIKPENADKLKQLGIQIKNIINKEIKVQHPQLAHIKTVDLVEFYDTTTNPKADLKNVVVFGLGQLDRSPCGTGTAAKLATLYKKGEIKKGEKFVYESITSTLFKGEILATTKIGDYEAIIPQITASAYITGFSQYVIDEDDPLKHGFLL